MLVLLFLLSLLSLAFALPLLQEKRAASTCSSEMRLAAARQIPYAYNLQAPGASAAAFKEVPFASNCITSM